ncbi:hypothetical protein ACFQS7_12805 [Dankookia sp. GCM10030260]|uniref:hypothetical protein n=1 Tax=Dankookia sp. GCM10030260 TaxID=3273390 RepID=UPI003617827D
MPIPRWLPLLACLLAVPARATDPVWHEPLWLQPPGADAPFPVLLALPLGWQPGDAAVVLLPDPAGPAAPRRRLVEALLAAEAVVVELDPLAAWAMLPALRPHPALSLPAYPAALRAALDRLRVETGAGLLVVLGLGPAGAVALAAAAWPGVAAAAALGDAPRILAGAPPPAAEQWPLRAGLLCALLAEAADGAPAPRDCRAALLR